MSHGKFITIEGIEGGGKSSVIQSLQTSLRAHGFPTHGMRQPGGSEIAEELRECLLRHYDEEYCSMAELLTVFASRAQALATVIKPRLQEGTWVVCDRFTDSTYAYQGAGRGMPSDVIARVEMLVQGAFRPDLTLILDIDVAEGLARTLIRDTGKKQDRMNCEHVDFYQKCRDLYLEKAAKNPKRYVVIDASRSKEDVACLVWKAVQTHLIDVPTTNG